MKALLKFAALLLCALPLTVYAQTKQEILQCLRGLGHGSYLFGQMATWVHNETPDLDHPSNWLKKIRDHTGVMPAYGCLTYDFDDDPFTDARWNEGVKQMWDRGLLVGVYSFYANPCGAKWNDPLQIEPIFALENNPVKANFYRQMERMAANLEWLKNRVIVVTGQTGFGCWNQCEAGCRSITMFRTARIGAAGSRGPCTTAHWKRPRRLPRRSSWARPGPFSISAAAQAPTRWRF